MAYRVIWSLPAKRDLKEIISYIREGNLHSARKFSHHLSRKLKLLENHPELGRFVPEFEDKSVRDLVVAPYRIIYFVNHLQKRLEISRVWHGARGAPEL